MTSTEEQQEEDETKKGSFLSLLLAYSWVFPPLITLIVGWQINFRIATLVSAAISWILLGIGYITRDKDQPWKPKTLDVVNPVAMSILTPIAWLAGEDFCRLWMGVLILAVFALVTWGSLLTSKPLLTDFIPLGDDERLHPVTKDVIVGMTMFLGTIFVIMWASNMVVALRKLEVGTQYVIFNFVIPYGTLGMGIFAMKSFGMYFWVQSAEKHYGENWKQTLFPDEEKDEKQEESFHDDENAYNTSQEN